MMSRVGKSGVLNLSLRQDHAGKTVISKSYSEIPLYVQKALYPDETNLAYLYMTSVSGGVLQGDTYHIDIDMAAGTQSHITTQGATRVYRSESDLSSQIISIKLDEGTYLEFIPDQLIPYRESRFYQKLLFNVHTSATMIYSEILAPGRVASGESFDFDVCNLFCEARDNLGKYRLMDATNIIPKKQSIKSFGVMNQYQMMGTIYILCTPDIVQYMHKQILSIISREKVFAGVTVLHNDSGLLIRILDDDIEPIKKTILDVVGALRKHVLGQPFLGVRKS